MKVYWAGPLLGGFCAGFIYQVSFKERPSREIHAPESFEKRREHP
jgi:hypothetical protein